MSGSYVAEPQLPLDIPVSTAPRHGRPFSSVQHSPLVTTRARLVAASACFAGLFMIAALRLVDATLLQNDKAVAEKTAAVAIAAPAPIRADIRDRNGELLATSLPTQSLYADPARTLAPIEAAKGLVKVLPDLKYEDVLDKLTSGKRFVWLKRNLTPEQVYQVNALGQPGLEFETEYTRVYPAGAATAHVTGYTDVDGRGLGGIERGLNQKLTDGTKPVTLSLDLRLQTLVRSELKKGIKSFSAIGGSTIVMDAWTGEVLAAVSLPDFDPLAPDGNEEASFNRFSQGVYELGSVMKIINTAAGLESGKMSLNSFYDAAEPIRFGRHTINDFHPEDRSLSVAEVFIYSSNIGAARMALDYGTSYQHQFLCQLGLCEKLALEIPESGAPLLPKEWRDINAMTISFGHGISISALQMVRATAATINGGVLVNPTFMAQGAVDGPVGRQVISAETSDKMRRLMRANVVVGSGKSAEVAGYEVGGKTGTAEKTMGKRYSADARISSFIGAFPMQNPRYVIYTMIDEPKPNATSAGYATGGWVAAPVVGSIVARMGPLYGMAPSQPDDPAIRSALGLEIKTRRQELASF